MKTIRTIAAIAAIIAAASCTKDPIQQTPKPDMGSAPAISFTEGDETVIYPAEYDGTATMLFEARDADDVSVEAENGLTVTTELTRLEDDCWKLELSGAEDMEKGRKYEIHITATNEYGVDGYTTYVETAYMENPFGAVKAEYFTNRGKEFDVFVENNVEWDVTVSADDQSWYELVDKDRGHFTFVIHPNETKSTRELTITVTDKAGVFSYSCVYGQDRCDETHEEIVAREKAAIIALCDAFGLEYDTNFEMQENGDLMFAKEEGFGSMGIRLNGKGYVYYIGISYVQGAIPEEIGDLKFCKELLITGELSGNLPERLGEMKSLKSISITGMNKHGLEGDLEASSLALIAPQLYFIDLSENNFTGPCPEWLGDTPEKAIFWIFGNRLEGKVPEKVKAHPNWNRVIPDGSGKLAKEENMIQQEGYVLYE